MTLDRSTRLWLWAVSAMLTIDVVAWGLALLRGVYWPVLADDFLAYRDAAARWFAGGDFYWPIQLVGPYDVWALKPMPILYPPPTIPLFGIFAAVPAVLWWAIPAVVIGLVTLRMRPRRLALVLMASLAAFPSVVSAVWTGNPLMWIVAALALGTLNPLFAPFVLLKPTLAPFALFGARRSTWWVGVGILLAISVLFTALWPDYVIILMNSRRSDGPLYSLWQVPAMLIPIAAWAGGLAPRGAGLRALTTDRSGEAAA